METRKIILTRGIQGSGKSFFARNWTLEDPEHRVRFNNDDIRNMLGKYWVPKRESLVTNMKLNFLTQATDCGYDIVIDNMNLNPKELAFYKSFVDKKKKKNQDKHYELEFKDFKTPLEVCIERDSKRENPIGENVIRNTYNRYKNFYETESNNC